MTITEAAGSHFDGGAPRCTARGPGPPGRVIQREVENPISRQVLGGAFAAGDTVLVDHTTDGDYTAG